MYCYLLRIWVGINSLYFSSSLTLGWAWFTVMGDCLLSNCCNGVGKASRWHYCSPSLIMENAVSRHRTRSPMSVQLV